MSSLPGAPGPFYARPAFIVLALLIMVCVSFGLSINNGFVWDDETFIVNNPHVHDISQLPLYFTQSDTISDDPVLSRMYRPIQTLSFALDAAVWGTWAGGFHLTSLLLHMATCFAMFFALSPLVGNRNAFIADAIFSIHPAISEGVLSLASRGNQLYTLFALLSLGFFVRLKKPLDTYHFVSLFTATLALLSKEPAIAYLALLPLIQITVIKPWRLRCKQSVLLYAPFFLIAVIYLWARSTVVGSPQVVPYWGGSLGATILLQAEVFIVYLKLLLWPFQLQGRYSVGEIDASTVVALVANIALVIVAVFAWRKSQKGKFLTLAIAWFYLSLAPVSNLIPLPGAMMGERFIYFTFAGMIPLLLGSFDYRVRRKHTRKIALVAVVVLTVFTFTNMNRSLDWRDNYHFFKVLTEQEPENPVIQLRMAQSDLEAGNTALALSRLEQLVKDGFSTTFEADRAAVSYWYGKSLLLSNRPKEALIQFTQTAALSPNPTLDLILLQVEAAARSNDLITARKLLEQELQTSPGESTLWNAFGNVLSMSGNLKSAVDAYTKAVELDPLNKEAAINLQTTKNRITNK